MTLIVSLRIPDGIVIAADSLATVMGQGQLEATIGSMGSNGYAQNILAKFWRRNKMKQTAAIKNLRIVQVPITQCLYPISSSTNLPFRAFVPIAEQMRALGEGADLSSVELTSDDTLGNEEPAQETEDTDPLLALAGRLKCDVTDIKKHYSDPVRPKIRVVKGAHEDNPDPLLALAGTLECDVTDIGERHDDYIADALLAELWGDEDE